MQSFKIISVAINKGAAYTFRVLASTCFVLISVKFFT